MPEVVYRDLRSVGLPFVTPDDEGFGAAVRTVTENSWMPVPEPGDEPAAVLVNLTGKTIVAMAVVWKYTGGNGETTKRRISTGTSGAQAEALRGRGTLDPHMNGFVLPRSQRLITQDGVYGDNEDVMGPEMRRQGGVFAGAGRAGFRGGGFIPVRIELLLDVAMLEDGRALGPDESGMVDAVVTTLDEQRRVAIAMLAAMAEGTTRGQLFDMIRPLAQGRRRTESMDLPLREMFLHVAPRMLLQEEDDALSRWLESLVEAPRITWRRDG